MDNFMQDLVFSMLDFCLRYAGVLHNVHVALVHLGSHHASI